LFGWKTSQIEEAFRRFAEIIQWCVLITQTAVLPTTIIDEGEDQTKWGIAALIRYKYLFKNRPKPA